MVSTHKITDNGPTESTFSLRKFLKIKTSHYEIVFWMCFVAFILLGAYVKITMALELHWFFVIYSVSLATLIVGRYVFFMLYSPSLTKKGKYNPEVNAIITSWNESKKVYLTVKSLVKGNYPSDKLKITVVDDGSTDDTSYWLSKAGKEFGCKEITLENNCGKRSAIHTALKECNSEIAILIDSDVEVAKNGISEIVRGFSNDKIAIVCGNTGVGNADTNLLTRMQEFYYYLSYGLFRSAE